MVVRVIRAHHFLLLAGAGAAILVRHKNDGHWRVPAMQGAHNSKSENKTVHVAVRQSSTEPGACCFALEEAAGVGSEHLDKLILSDATKLKFFSIRDPSVNSF